MWPHKSVVHAGLRDAVPSHGNLASRSRAISMEASSRPCRLATLQGSGCSCASGQMQYHTDSKGLQFGNNDMQAVASGDERDRAHAAFAGVYGSQARVYGLLMFG